MTAIAHTDSVDTRRRQDEVRGFKASPALADNLGRVLVAAVNTLRTVRHPVEAEDPSTADILDQQIEGLENLAWLIKSENRRV